MSQEYSNPARESDPYALPDVEVWEERIAIIHSHCGDFSVPDWARGFCPSCDRATCVEEVEHTDRSGWFYWFCSPGCLPDSDAIGPFDTYAEALADAREATS